MTAHARIRVGRVLAQTIFAEDVVFGFGNIGGFGTRPHGRDTGFERFEEDAEGIALRVVGATDDERPANLRVVAVDFRREFGCDEIAIRQRALGGRDHSAYVDATWTRRYTVFGAAARAQERLDVGDELVLFAARNGGAAKDRVGLVG